MKHYIIMVAALLWCATATAQEQQVMMEDMTGQELSERIRNGATTALIFSGGTEASGPHLVLGKHQYRVRAYAAAIARELGNALVAPVLPFAPNSPVLQELPGTITLQEQTFYQVNEEVARSLAAAGFQYIILMSDHYNSQQPLRRVAAKLDSSLQTSGVRIFFSGDGYGKARIQIEQSLAAKKQVPGGHGGFWDTAETWAVAPAAVRPGNFAVGDTTKGGNGPLNAAGMSGDPRSATPEAGRAFGKLRVQLAVAEIKALITTAGQQARR